MTCTFGGGFSISSLSKSTNGGGGTHMESRIGFVSLSEYSWSSDSWLHSTSSESQIFTVLRTWDILHSFHKIYFIYLISGNKIIIPNINSMCHHVKGMLVGHYCIVLENYPYLSHGRFWFEHQNPSWNTNYDINLKNNYLFFETPAPSEFPITRYYL